MKQSSSSKKKKRSGSTRLDASFSHASLTTKAVLLALGIMGGVLVAAGAKSLFIKSDRNEIDISESIESSKSNDTRSSKTRASRSTLANKANRAKLAPAPEPERIVEERVEEEKPTRIAAPEPVREKPAVAAPKRKAITVIASVPVPVAARPSPVAVAPAPVAAPAVAVVKPKAQARPVAPAPVPTVKAVAVKNVEDQVFYEEIPEYKVPEPTRPTAVIPKEKPRKIETVEKVEKETTKVASHPSKDDNFHSRLKKTKKVEVVEAETEDPDTATSPFQDRLRKSLK